MSVKNIKFKPVVYINNEYDFSDEEFIDVLEPCVVLKQGSIEVEIPLYLLDEQLRHLRRSFKNFEIRTFHKQGSLFSIRYECCNFFEYVYIIRGKLFQFNGRSLNKFIKRMRRVSEVLHKTIKTLYFNNLQINEDIRCRIIKRYYAMDGNPLK